LAALCGAHRHLNSGQRLELCLDRLFVLLVADNAISLGTLDVLDLLLCAAARNDGVAAWQQVVTSVTSLDFNDVAGDTELVNGGGADQLHAPTLSLSMECCREQSSLPLVARLRGASTHRLVQNGGSSSPTPKSV